MANIGHFMIPADNVDRAKHFYHKLLGWKIEPAKNTWTRQSERCNTMTSSPAQNRKGR